MTRVFVFVLLLALVLLGGCSGRGLRRIVGERSEPSPVASTPAKPDTTPAPATPSLARAPGVRPTEAAPANAGPAPGPSRSAAGTSPSTRRGDRFGVTLAATELDPRTPRGLEMAGQAGIGWVRLQFLRSRIEPQRGRFTWQQFDALAAKARASRLEIMGNLAYATQWDTTAPPTEVRPARREMYPPSDYPAWEHYVSEVVSRYKDDVHIWEVWNEPDLRAFWGGTPADYARLLALTHQAVKRADPGAQVAIGGLSLGGTPGRFDPEFLQQVLADPAHPAGQNFEVAAFHHYGPLSEARRRMDYVRGALDGSGEGNRPVWITEVGFASDSHLQREQRYQNGPESQAAWLKDYLPALLKGGVAKVFWFTLFDDPKAGANFSSHGLLDGELNPKPAYGAYRDLIASFAGD